MHIGPGEPHGNYCHNEIETRAHPFATPFEMRIITSDSPRVLDVILFLFNIAHSMQAAQSSRPIYKRLMVRIGLKRAETHFGIVAKILARPAKL